jgi:hypothetical protein
MDQRRTDAIPHVQELQQRGHPSQQQDVAMMPTVSAGMRPVRTTRSTLGPTMQVWIGILGPLQVRVGSGEPVEVVGPRLRFDPTIRLDLAVRATRVETRTSTESHEADLHHQHAPLSRLLDRLEHELVHEIPACPG